MTRTIRPAAAFSSELYLIKELEQESRELKRTNEILERAASFFGAELCATRRRMYREVVRPELGQFSVHGQR